MKSEIFSEMKQRVEKSVEALGHELSSLRTGRASTALFDVVKVDYYGSLTPLAQMASLTVPEPRTVIIQPWDVTQLGAIEKAILQSDLGLNPSNDGKIIRVNLPPLTEERRKELVKLAHKYGEECKISIRNARKHANDMARKLEKDKEIGQDDLKKIEDEIQKITGEQTSRIDHILAEKETDIMEV